LRDDRRIRIQEAKKYVDPDPEHCWKETVRTTHRAHTRKTQPRHIPGVDHVHGVEVSVRDVEFAGSLVDKTAPSPEVILERYRRV
jgi:hypothetical protein